MLIVACGESRFAEVVFWKLGVDVEHDGRRGETLSAQIEEMGEEGECASLSICLHRFSCIRTRGG